VLFLKKLAALAQETLTVKVSSGADPTGLLGIRVGGED
jgi:hypothetical protein